MQEPPRKRGRSRRRGPQRPRPTQAPAQPEAPRERAAPARPATPRPAPARPPRREGERGRGAPQRRGRPRPRTPPGERGGTPVVIVLDRREGEPDLTGARGIFEGYFDPETGDRRGPERGVPRLRVGNDRIWGIEVWWRPDPGGEGLTPTDHEELEVSKKMLRGLLREARRQSAFARRPPSP